MLAAWSISMRGRSQWPLFFLTSSWSLDLRWLSLSWRRLPFWSLILEAYQHQRFAFRVCQVRPQMVWLLWLLFLLLETRVSLFCCFCIIYLQDNARLKVCQVQNHGKRASGLNFNLRMSSFSLSFICIWVFKCVFSVRVCDSGALSFMSDVVLDHSPIIHWNKILTLNTELSDCSWSAGQLAPGIPSLSSWTWNGRQAALSPWNWQRFWGSDLWSSFGYSKHLNHWLILHPWSL